MKTVINRSQPARFGESRPSNDSQRPIGPQIDWSYQTSAPALRGPAGVFRRGTRPSLAGFRALSDSFFAAEAKREFVLEALGFVVLSALAAWPIVQAAQALHGLIR